MYVDTLYLVRVTIGKNEIFRIERGVRVRCVMFPRLLYMYMDGARKEVKMRIEGMELRFSEE